MTAFRIGTRGSTLARTQTTTVATAVSQIAGLDHELKIIRTAGDVTTGSLASLGGAGVFASALRAAILDGEVDLAVHSLKDLPAKQPAGLQIVAVPPRGDVRDALCARDALTLQTLPQGAKVGTGSPRRVAQLLAARPDVQMVDIRGNVQTRLARVPGLEQHDDDAPAAAGSPRGDLDAVVLACSGLDRVGMDWAITERLDPTVVLPAPGQGALAVECRPEMVAKTSDLTVALAEYDDDDTRLQTTAERALLTRLEAGCAAPLGALAYLERTEGELRLTLDAVVAATDGTRVLRSTETIALSDAPVRDQHHQLNEDLLAPVCQLGVTVAEALLAEGADLLPVN